MLMGRIIVAKHNEAGLSFNPLTLSPSHGKVVTENMTVASFEVRVTG